MILPASSSCWCSWHSWTCGHIVPVCLHLPVAIFMSLSSPLLSLMRTPVMGHRACLDSPGCSDLEIKGASQLVLMGKNLPASSGGRDSGSIPVSGRCPGRGHGNPLKYSYLENPHGQRGLVGYSPWDCKELDMAEVI